MAKARATSGQAVNEGFQDQSIPEHGQVEDDAGSFSLTEREWDALYQDSKMDTGGAPVRSFPADRAEDIAELRLAQAKVRKLLQGLMSAQEEQRRVMARELHDGIGQSLAVLMLSLNLARREQSGKVSPHLQKAESLVKDLIAQVRGLSRDLRPAMLDEFGLLAALVWLFERWDQKANLRVKFTHRGFCRDIPSDVGIAAYRIVEEALTNVARHARVNQATVMASVDNEVLLLRIEDRGLGFHLDAPASRPYRGIEGMKQRAWLAGGDLRMFSTPGCGTAVLVKLPLSRPAEDSGTPAEKKGVTDSVETIPPVHSTVGTPAYHTPGNNRKLGASVGTPL